MYTLKTNYKAVGSVIELHNFKKSTKLKPNPMLEFQRRSSISSRSLSLIFDDIPRVEG